MGFVVSCSPTRILHPMRHSNHDAGDKWRGDVPRPSGMARHAHMQSRMRTHSTDGWYETKHMTLICREEKGYPCVSETRADIQSRAALAE